MCIKYFMFSVNNFKEILKRNIKMTRLFIYPHLNKNPYLLSTVFLYMISNSMHHIGVTILITFIIIHEKYVLLSGHTSTPIAHGLTIICVHFNQQCNINLF